MNRRDFVTNSLKALVGVGAFVVGLQSVELTKSPLILYGDGIHDDTDALNAWGNNETVYYSDGRKVGDRIEGKKFRISDDVSIQRTGYEVEYNKFWLFGNSRISLGGQNGWMGNNYLICVEN